MKKMLIMSSSKPSTPSSIDAGTPGFGVGVADSATLSAIGNLEPMSGYDNPYNDNYGNYQSTDGDNNIMCFIPAFCYRSGYDSAPSKSRDGLNALEITYDTSMESTDGWILHRAFWNNGHRVSGFFVDKYLNSKNSAETKSCSVKNGDPLTLYKSAQYNGTIQLPNCNGYLYDAIVLGRKRGTRYACCSLFAYSALAMLSLAHSQACGEANAKYCAWNDSYSYPWCKGNNDSLKDYYDSSVTYTAATTSSTSKGLTGSGTPFAKTTHNGQNCGVADISASLYEVALGVTQPKLESDGRYGNLLVLKTSADVCAIESYSTNIDDATLYDEVAYTRNSDESSPCRWPNTIQQFSPDSSGDDWALTGCYPRSNGEATSSSVGYLIKGYYYYGGVTDNYSSYCPVVGGCYGSSDLAGLFYRDYAAWDYRDRYVGFRCLAISA